jgi:hypothetical protein
MRRFALVKLWVELSLDLHHALKGVPCEPIAQFPSICLLGCCGCHPTVATVTRCWAADGDSGLDFWVAMSVGLGGGDCEWVD